MSDTGSTDATLEILDTGAAWAVTPGVPVRYSICVRNGTQESHEILVSVGSPVDWVQIVPERLSLPAGGEERTTIVFSIPSEASVSAGPHDITLELHDFEGTSFGQLTSCVAVLTRFRIEIALELRGPLVRRDVVDGIILRCSLVNRGNSECLVAFNPESACIAFDVPDVRVPAGAQVAFDIEARWTADALPVYPDTIGVLARYSGGTAVASVPWNKVSACLGSALPPLREHDEFPGILPPRSISQESESTAKAPHARLASEPPSSAGTSAPVLVSPANPVRVQINGPSSHPSPHGHKLHPWWPPVERLGSRLVVKRPTALTFTLAALVVSLLVLQKALAPSSTTPLGAWLHLPPQTRQSQRHLPPPVSATSAHAQSGAGKRQATPARSRTSAHVSRASQPHASAPAFRGSAFEGRLLHASAANIKVRDASSSATRSFILTPGTHVYGINGIPLSGASHLPPGSLVRVYFSYTLGIRHANAIVTLSR